MAEENETPREAGRGIMRRRNFLLAAAAGTVVAGMYVLSGEDESRQYREARRPDGRVRLPPGQRVVRALREMGGTPGDPSPSNFRLKVHGEVDHPLEIDYASLLKMPQVEQVCDVHCVTGWSMLDSRWTGTRFLDLARLAGVRATARHVIFEAAAGYTANVPLREAMQPDVLVAYQLGGDPLPSPHGSPVRALVPSLYFWKSAKWLTGIYFSGEDQPGFWEVRGYHNHGDPWREERYS